jgi:hypothetical protein
MRLALIDMMFSWPPQGGADVDLYHVATQLQRLGHEICLFGIDNSEVWDRGHFDTDSLPFPAQRIPSPRFECEHLAAEFRTGISNWQPDAVYIGDVFFFKPQLILALKEYPLVSRYYAYELACHRDVLRFKDGQPCPQHYLKTPEVCRPCASEFLGPAIKKGHLLAWTQEYLATKAYGPDYHRLLTSSLEHLNAAVVYNSVMADLLAGYCDQVFVIPGGVNAEAFSPTTPAEKGTDDTKIILMTGRGEDPAK